MSEQIPTGEQIKQAIANDQKTIADMSFLIAKLEAENEEWKAYYRDATDLAEAVSMSGNMRISPSDKIKMNAMKARLDALLTGEDDDSLH